MSEDTPRLALPLLAAGQSQKELWHNEALARLDQLVQASVDGWNVDVPPSAPAPGQCWIVGSAPSGDWVGRAGAIAGWTESGWRYVEATDGFAAWSLADAAVVRRVAGQWRLDPVRANALVISGEQVIGTRSSAIANPSGGTMIDDVARDTIALLLAALRHHGLIAPSP